LIAQRLLQPPRRDANVVEEPRGGESRCRAENLLQRDHGLLGFVDPERVLGQPQRHEPRAQLVQLAAAGALLGNLGERNERGSLSHELTVCDRPTGLVEREPAVIVAGPVRAQVEPAARLGLGREDPGKLLSVVGVAGRRRGDLLEVVLKRHAVTIDSPTVDAVELFAPLGPTYDRYARLFSFGQDPRWRRFLVSRLEVGADDTVLDVATGTAAVAIELVRRTGCRVVGLDQSAEMLANGRRRVEAAGFADRIELLEGAAERLPFEDGSFEALSVTYLLRYVEDPAATMQELVRVVKPGGMLAMLEFGLPSGLARPPWELYVRVGLPALGALASPGWRRVGAFLGPSIREFHRRHDLAGLWRAAGIEDVRLRRLALGGGLVLWGRRA
jgi:demethylmenaquinone methyltransferase / 2-methoxy-6-polyprenyl-1,4-benzoquinol methylase